MIKFKSSRRESELAICTVNLPNLDTCREELAIATIVHSRMFDCINLVQYAMLINNTMRVL